jgi:formylglycine-generating enzyme required for sulfatase activity
MSQSPLAKLIACAEERSNRDERYRVSPREIADALFLARRFGDDLWPASARAAAQEHDERHPHNESAEPDAASETRPQAGDLVVRGGEKSSDNQNSGVTTKPFRAPSAAALPGIASIARALRPLRRRVPSPVRRELDEDATVTRTGETGLLAPVLRSAPERWLEVALVVDDSRSMNIWRPAVEAFRRLLERYGAFRTVRMWTATSDAGAFALTGEFSAAPSDRRLVVVVSDCVSPAWRTGAAFAQLAEWGRKHPLVLAQPFPPRLWTRTGLRDALADVAYDAAAPGAVNARLRFLRDPDDPDAEPVPRDVIPLPIVTLEEWSLAPWAKLVAGLPDSDAAWALIPPPKADASPAPDLQPPEDAETLVGKFRASASPSAYRLACYLASLQFFTLSILHLVRTTLLPNLRLVHEAEVFLSGLLKKEANADRAEDVVYGFRDGVRERLRRAVPISERKRVVAEISRFIAERQAQFRSFLAALAVPGDGMNATAAGATFAQSPQVVTLPPRFVNAIGMEFVLVSAGKFVMGSTEADERRWSEFLAKYGQNANYMSRERPAHEVTIAAPFYLGKYPVTQGEWAAVMGSNPSWFKGDDRLPVETVSWEDCQEFIGKLNARKDGYVYRLPSEAEWEYACRAGTTGDYAGELDALGWCADNSGDKRLDAYQAYTDAGYDWDTYYKTFLKPNNCRTHAVGQKRPNGFGVYDMHGNVWEWCQDGWHENYDGAPTDGRAWEQGSDNQRVVRGGSWLDLAGDCRAAFRFRSAPDIRDDGVGVRVAVRLATN